ncbi:transmembrane family of transporters domain-containing protein [Ditylenchus destructor]|nr:transmembrane family of transporters domain-containing protein [Ditylenchus destructor]
METVSTADLITGLTLAFTSAALFGSVFVPTKARKNCDAIFVQWLMSTGLLISGFCILPFGDFPAFHPFATVSGVAWAIANALVLPVIQEIGLGPAFLLADNWNALLQFVISYCGLLWTKARPPKTPWLAFLGLVIVLLSGAIISRVKKKVPEKIPSESAADLVLEEKEKQTLGTNLASFSDFDMYTKPTSQSTTVKDKSPSFRILLRKIRRPL